MVEKSEEAVVREKAQVAAMKNAQATMTAVLERNSKLERALAQARVDLVDCAKYIPETVYVYTSSGGAQRTVRDLLKEYANRVSAVLG